MSDIESDPEPGWLASIQWPKRVDPDERKKILLFQFIEAYELVDVCFHSYKGTAAKMKHLSAWKKVWKHGLR